MSPASVGGALSRRVAAMSESATLAISAKAKELRAAGEDVIGFGAGEPDFPTPRHVVEAAQQAATDPAAHRYSPASGMAALKEAVVEKTARDTGLEATREQVVVSNGGKHALFNACLALLDPGDEVLVPAPYWTSYPEPVALAGAEPVAVATTVESGFRAGVEQLEAARTPRTKALIFTSPNNPTGAVHPPEEVAAIGRWAAEHGLWVVTDEIYEHLVFGGARFASLPVVAPEAAERCVVVNGVAKSYAMTGWRVGWTIAPTELSTAMATLQSHATSNVCNVAQSAAIAALTGPQDDVAVMRESYEHRGAIAHERLSAIDGVSCPEPQGAFYCFPSVAGLLGRDVGGRRVETSAQLCEALLETAKIALVPGEAFGAPGHVRLSYALGEHELLTGLDRLAKAVG
jgi:aspartate/methionine/tyrosine aminotransferase